MRSTLVFLGLFSVFMLVSSLPFAALGNGQANGATNTIPAGSTGGGNNGHGGHGSLININADVL
ncbi:hypothetical protein RO3G_13675 [Rhizopus delemar RA 99-880]|uniref:Uncharacterized protein n=1 Tax=Rhizopus delemar (strain RA 99-880 / ATCC MYA-4621 / FGSC 9543 / NRRL 43880) TaxID=246409 RepID=I1CKI4_RHIO9|nr:hypothetical protein RO3G_13675 [Rhizopus delemar RA 99-880]|eukprot:EIE88964.1 hypothetical protein RO3G_13675 [Rhizopus delemar RA 99-880]